MSLKESIAQVLPPSALIAARTARWRLAKVRSEMLASLPSRLDGAPSERPPAFVIGSGRSGTTALGAALGTSPSLRYFFEPVDRWYAISPETDYGGLFTAGAETCSLGADKVDDGLRMRFRRVFRSALVDGRQMVEKTPINAFRIAFLDAIDPRTKYVEIRRDGVDVVRSIIQLSRKNDYNLIGRGSANRWWGPDDCKWNSLSRDVRALEIEPEYLVPSAEFATRAAIEWIASLKVVERAAPMLGDRLYRVSYADLVSKPEETLEGIAAFLGAPPGDWIRRAGSSLGTVRRRQTLPLVLPGAIARRLNNWNERLGYSGRAHEGPHLAGFTTECQTTTD
jgi:hypothetical protein